MYSDKTSILKIRLHLGSKSHDLLDDLGQRMSQTYDGCSPGASHVISWTNSAIVCPRHTMAAPRVASHVISWTT